MRTAIRILVGAWLLALSTAAVRGQTQERYESAAIGNDGAIHISVQQGREVVIPQTPDSRFPEAEPVFLEKPILSNDGTAVGSRRFYHCCGNSSEIPLALMVYANGSVHEVVGNGLPIFSWHFDDDGTRVAYSQQAIHFDCFEHYELREIASGRLLDSADDPIECGAIPDPRPEVTLPDWALRLNRDVRERNQRR